VKSEREWFTTRAECLQCSHEDNNLAKGEREMNSLFDDFFGGFSHPTWQWYTTTVTDALQKTKDYDVKEEVGELTLTIDVPGVKLEDVVITTEKRRLDISTKRGEKKNAWKFDIAEDYDPSTVTANLAFGELTVTILKKEIAKPTVNTIKVTQG